MRATLSVRVSFRRTASATRLSDEGPRKPNTTSVNYVFWRVGGPCLAAGALGAWAVNLDGPAWLRARLPGGR